MLHLALSGTMQLPVNSFPSPVSEARPNAASGPSKSCNGVYAYVAQKALSTFFRTCNGLNADSGFMQGHLQFWSHTGAVKRLVSQ